MKQILVMMAAVVLVGCGDGRKEQAAIVERAIRHEFSLNKPEGELTEADLARVTFISVSFKGITDVGLKELVKLQNLEMLFLYDAQITDAGLKDVAKLQNLEELQLNGTQITDAGLKEVAKLQKLKKLYLLDTKITDAGLKELTKLQQLERLDLYDHTMPYDEPQITKAGVAELQKALPNCKIKGP